MITDFFGVFGDRTDKMRGQYLTKQILILVALCLFIAELLIFVPSAARFQQQWLDRQ